MSDKAVGLVGAILAVIVALFIFIYGIERRPNETSSRDSNPHVTADRVGGNETPDTILRPWGGNEPGSVTDGVPSSGPGQTDDEASGGRGGGNSGSPEARTRDTGLEDGGREDVSSAVPFSREGASPEGSGGSVSLVWGEPSSLWLQGYRAHGGNPAWERHFIEAVIPCEGREFNREWHQGDSAYVSVLQFDPATWETASHHTGHTNPENLSHVGANAAYWSNRVDPASTAGWADCW